MYVGADGVVNGDINAANVIAAGSVEGKISAAGFLKILSTGRVYGDISVYRLIADEGAVFEGKCSMSDTSGALSAQPDLRMKPQQGLFRKKAASERIAQNDRFELPENSSTSEFD